MVGLVKYLSNEFCGKEMSMQVTKQGQQHPKITIEQKTNIKIGANVIDQDSGQYPAKWELTKPKVKINNVAPTIMRINENLR